jgi:hypothetical protein
MEIETWWGKPVGRGVRGAEMAGSLISRDSRGVWPGQETNYYMFTFIYIYLRLGLQKTSRIFHQL